ncbi:unnamed protein product [Owenia fusiformis]|uniref:Chitin-binding type-2 domain-containing protein n=1 Tax=Owenia fusiformis TaxID=6347 RepID=A0A8S4NLZ1_OWEFU|nr:unnamed protein product [Owenia fusiformis]
MLSPNIWRMNTIKLRDTSSRQRKGSATVKHAMDSALEAKYDKSASGGYEEVDYEYDYDYEDSYTPPVFDVDTDPPTEPPTTTTTTTTTTTPIPTSTASTTTTDDPKFNFDDFCEDKPRLTKYKYKSDCDYYIYCVFNFGNLVPCPPGLTYNDETKECDENECEEGEEGEERKKRSGWLERLAFGQDRWHELWKMFGT